MSLNRFRGFLYRLAKFLGDIQALRSKKKGAIKRRIVRRVAGKALGLTVMRFIGGMFR